ncbi:GNAT family N-acetyltransferase [Hymenobacter amundsenii]|uniref:GNAT family N-acetyltransferase n=2 Tax=Hymenobacter amundsenii TaxID=2006685 RepID=A0A246FG81_9BACT|nr:GNAT family N-acetyltransferase [Hymenobacter amundsenii]
MIKLARMHPDEDACFYPWIADSEVIQYSLSAFQAMKTPAQIDDWFAATLRDEKSLNLGIYLQETDTLIGYAGISNLSATNRSGEYFILIGEKAYWGKGVGTAVTKQVLALGFTEHHLNRIMLTVSELNPSGIKAYTNAGFVVEGRLRAACCRDGLFHDKIVMSVLKEEWQPSEV